LGESFCSEPKDWKKVEEIAINGNLSIDAAATTRGQGPAIDESGRWPSHDGHKPWRWAMTYHQIERPSKKTVAKEVS